MVEGPGGLVARGYPRYLDMDPAGERTGLVKTSDVNLTLKGTLSFQRLGPHPVSDQLILLYNKNRFSLESAYLGCGR